MNRREFLAVFGAAALAAVATGEATASVPLFPNTLDGQAARLAVLTELVEAGFAPVYMARSRQSVDWLACKPAIYVGDVSVDTMVYVRTFTHRTYLNGRPWTENWNRADALCRTPKEAVDQFQEYFLPEAKRHAGTLWWRVKPEIREYEDPRTGEREYWVRHRCSFADTPDQA